MRWTASTERWRKLAEQTPPEKRLATIVDSYLTAVHRDDPGHGCAVPTLGAEIARESPRTRKAFAAKLEQMIDMLAEQIGRSAQGRAQAGDGGARDHDGNAGAGPGRRQWRVFRRDSRRRPRRRAGSRGAAKADEGEETRTPEGRDLRAALIELAASPATLVVALQRRQEPEIMAQTHAVQPRIIFRRCVTMRNR